MKNWYQFIAIMLFLVLTFLTGLFYSKEHKDNEKRVISVRAMARIGVFAAISTILYVVPGLKFSIPGLFPSFLEFHFDEIPALIAGFAFGPFSAFGIILIKTLIKIPLSGANTMYIGEISDFIYSLALILPAAIISMSDTSTLTAMTSMNGITAS